MAQQPRCDLKHLGSMTWTWGQLCGILGYETYSNDIFRMTMDFFNEHENRISQSPSTRPWDAQNYADAFLKERVGGQLGKTWWAPNNIGSPSWPKNKDLIVAALFHLFNKHVLYSERRGLRGGNLPRKYNSPYIEPRNFKENGQENALEHPLLHHPPTPLVETSDMKTHIISYLNSLNLTSTQTILVDLTLGWIQQTNFEWPLIADARLQYRMHELNTYIHNVTLEDDKPLLSIIMDLRRGTDMEAQGGLMEFKIFKDRVLSRLVHHSNMLLQKNYLEYSEDGQIRKSEILSDCWKLFKANIAKGWKVDTVGRSNLLVSITQNPPSGLRATNNPNSTSQTSPGPEIKAGVSHNTSSFAVDDYALREKDTIQRPTKRLRLPEPRPRSLLAVGTVAHEYTLPVPLQGIRLADQALAQSGCAPSSITQRSLSFDGPIITDAARNFASHSPTPRLNRSRDPTPPRDVDGIHPENERLPLYDDEVDGDSIRSFPKDMTTPGKLIAASKRAHKDCQTPLSSCRAVNSSIQQPETAAEFATPSTNSSALDMNLQPFTASSVDDKPVVIATHSHNILLESPPISILSKKPKAKSPLPLGVLTQIQPVDVNAILTPPSSATEPLGPDPSTSSIRPGAELLENNISQPIPPILQPQVAEQCKIKFEPDPQIPKKSASLFSLPAAEPGAEPGPPDESSQPVQPISGSINGEAIPVLPSSTESPPLDQLCSPLPLPHSPAIDNTSLQSPVPTVKPNRQFPFEFPPFNIFIQPAPRLPISFSTSISSHFLTGSSSAIPFFSELARNSERTLCRGKVTFQLPFAQNTKLVVEKDCSERQWVAFKRRLGTLTEIAIMENEEVELEVFLYIGDTRH